MGGLWEGHICSGAFDAVSILAVRRLAWLPYCASIWGTFVVVLVGSIQIGHQVLGRENVGEGRGRVVCTMCCVMSSIVSLFGNIWMLTHPSPTSTKCYLVQNTSQYVATRSEHEHEAQREYIHVSHVFIVPSPFGTDTIIPLFLSASFATNNHFCAILPPGSSRFATPICMLITYWLGICMLPQRHWGFQSSTLAIAIEKGDLTSHQRKLRNQNQVMMTFLSLIRRIPVYRFLFIVVLICTLLTTL